MNDDQAVLKTIEDRANQILNWLNQRQQRDLARAPQFVNVELTAWMLALEKCLDFTKFAMDDAVLHEAEKIARCVKAVDGRSSLGRVPHDYGMAN